MESETGPEAGETARPTEPGADSTPFAPVEPLTPQPPTTQPDMATPPPPFAAPPPPYPQQPYPQPYPYPQQPFPPQTWTAPGQTPPNPYGYPPHAYGFPQPPTGTNGMAVAAMALGICGFFFVTPVLGLIFGFVALSAIRRTGQHGKGQAVTGIVLSSLWIALYGTLITVGALHGSISDPARRDANGTVIASGEVPVFALQPKDCFTFPGGNLGTAGSTDHTTRTMTVVPCSSPHDSEEFGSFIAAETTLPSADTLRAEGTPGCLTVLNGYLEDLGGLPTGSLIQFIYPADQQTWDQSGHRVECFIQFRAATVTKAVYRDPSSYTADQSRFLGAIHPLIYANSQLGVLPPTASLTVRRQRAGDAAAAVQIEIKALTDEPWPSDVQPDVDALVASHRAAGQAWTRAASATDDASFTDASSQADAALDMTDLKAVRVALGLTVVTPDSTG